MGPGVRLAKMPGVRCSGGGSAPLRVSQRPTPAPTSVLPVRLASARSPPISGSSRTRRRVTGSGPPGNTRSGPRGCTVLRVSRRSDDQQADAFADEVLRVVREEAADVVGDGSGQLEEGHDGGGTFIRLVPTNPAACALTVYPDYPTLCLGPEQHTTEMFGPEETRLRELRQLVRAVIAGRYEWRHRQVTRRILFIRLGPYTQLVGTFHTDDGPWVFTRQGAEPRGAVEHRTYEPYRP